MAPESIMFQETLGETVVKKKVVEEKMVNASNHGKI